MRYDYQSYASIPETIQSYILTVTGFTAIEAVSLNDINEYLNALMNFYEEVINNDKRYSNAK